MIPFASKVRTARAIGLPSIARALLYRIGIKSGLNPVGRLAAKVPQGAFYHAAMTAEEPLSKNPAWVKQARLFGHSTIDIGLQAPDWLSNILTGVRVDGADQSWTKIADFDPKLGDIKLVWELSRFDWVVAFAQHIRSGDSKDLVRLNRWLADWCLKNPPYCGPNWKCGQEASIRIMHLAVAALILDQVHQPTSALRDLVRLHLRRIAPTIQYAVAQDNNHGTSEAAALFIGGSWLANLGDADGARWSKRGRRWLENRTDHLISDDGSFSQYSLNYHRVLLDTLAIAEVWRRKLDLPEFSERFHIRARSATQWLRHMIDPLSGEGPNVGANDGALLLNFSDAPYRDYRPSVQLASALFTNNLAYPANSQATAGLHWFGVPPPKTQMGEPGSQIADDGGFAVIRRGRAMAMLRYPRFRFRPSQADALHLDLWRDGRNLLRDGGTFSYAAEPIWLDYFGGTESHNTVQFDNRDQMPRLSRFLFADWLKTSHIEPLTEGPYSTVFGAGYVDSYKARHTRHIELRDDRLIIRDDIADFTEHAVLRWRLAPGAWVQAGCTLKNGSDSISVEGTMPIARCSIEEGWESRHYGERRAVPVFEIQVREAGTITTEYRWTV